MSKPEMNTFRAADAFEYVDAYRTGVAMGIDKLREKMLDLAQRMGRAVEMRGEVDSHLLAAYRGYEDAQMWLTRRISPTTVKIDDRY